MKSLLSARLIVLAALLGAGLTAQAQVRYTFTNSVETFSLVTPSLVVTQTTFAPGQLESFAFSNPGRTLSGVRFNVNAQPGFDGLDVFTSNGATDAYLLPQGSFGSFGTHNVFVGMPNVPGTLKVQAVPEPGTMIALAVGGLSLLRRRRATAPGDSTPNHR